MRDRFNQVSAFAAHENQTKLKLFNAWFNHGEMARKKCLDLALAVFCRLQRQPFGQADEVEGFIPAWVPKQSSEGFQRRDPLGTWAKFLPIAVSCCCFMHSPPLHPGRRLDRFEELP